ncbi:helix-turn-helix domain-containing protein [Natronorubrum thiooxidans]|uniref:Predicted transcriptional regulator n=1 Tax=Natronorubrum thiooxidans TaxID=308853 RepID=A0A1N7GLY0_9EURY|nr:helix-turn-helix domain-containing protein [Natronorubrum thiooxidans]SIS13605.1 Predicted transcriptional regulator [Natronorubrum thiooxidans]
MTSEQPSEDELVEALESQRSKTNERQIKDEFYGIYECVTCSNVCLTIRDPPETMTCHGESMRRVTTCSIDVQTPEVESVLLEAFGLPKAGIDICTCVINQRAASASQVADLLGYDRSTVTRYLNKLVEVGMLDRHQLNREDGGVVNVYTGLPIEDVKRETIVGFYVWAGEAAKLIEAANLQKEQQLDERSNTEDEEKPMLIWERLKESMRSRFEGSE